MVTRSRSESGWYTSLFEMNKLFIIHKNRGSVYLKQKLCLSPIEVLFKINTGSIETELASARTNFFRLKGLKALPPLRACQRWDIKQPSAAISFHQGVCESDWRAECFYPCKYKRLKHKCTMNRFVNHYQSCDPYEIPLFILIITPGICEDVINLTS